MIVMEHDRPVFVGEIALIVSSSPAGPRGGLPLRAGNDFSNLLLLCARHHKIIDDPATAERYTVEVLRSWKYEQEQQIEASALGQLDQFGDLRAQLPGLLVQSFQVTTSELSAAVDRVEEVGLIAHESAKLLRDAVDRIPERGPRIGEGIPGIEPAFQLAYDTAGGVTFLGPAASLAYEDGPGYVQHLRGGSCGDAAVLCALPGSYAVAVTGELWAAICQQGHPSLGGGPSAVGFPAARAGGARRYIGPEVSKIETLGGTWGPGRMVRRASGGWRWRPETRLDSNAHRDRNIWTAGADKMDLRLRFAARIPWLGNELRIRSAGRRRLDAELAQPWATEVVRAFGHSRPTIGETVRWTKTSELDGRNDSWGAAYTCALRGPGGRPAIVGRVLAQLPGGPQDGSFLSLVDVRLDFDAMWPGAARVGDSPVPPELRVTVPELAAFFSRAWGLAMTTLPQAVTGTPDDLTTAGASRVEMYVVNERSPNTGGDRILQTGDMLDLSPFGSTTRNHYELAAGITVAMDQAEPQIHTIVRSALVWMAEDCGFTDADLADW